MQPRILAVYNLCGLKHNNISIWRDYIYKLATQDDPNFDLAISACNVDKETKKILEDQVSHFDGGSMLGCKRACVNFIDDILPAQVTFNRTCQLFAHEKYTGKIKYDGFLYVASDVECTDRLAIQKLVDFHFAGPDSKGSYGHTAAYVDKDHGLEYHPDRRKAIQEGKNLTFGQGHAFHTHFNLIDKSVYEAFGNRCLPDIFAAFCAESVYCYIVAAVDKRLGMLNAKDLTLHHIDNLDGCSVGFPDHGTKEDVPRGPYHLFRSKIGAKERCMSREAWSVGFGYEELRGYFPHDRGWYINGYHKNPELLKNFVKKAVFLSRDEFDYDTIK